jgi:hypothetical protein
VLAIEAEVGAVDAAVLRLSGRKLEALRQLQKGVDRAAEEGRACALVRMQDDSKQALHYNSLDGSDGTL